MSGRIGRGPVVAWLVSGLVAAGSGLAADPASASPGFERLGGPVALGIDQDDPAPVVHEGRLYLAVIERHVGRAMLAVSRLAEDGRWQQIGAFLNARTDGVAGRPVLLSSGGVLYAGWIEIAPGEQHGEVMLARLEQLHDGTVRWGPAVPGRAPQATLAPLRLAMLQGLPVVLYGDPHGTVLLGLGTPHGWVIRRPAELIPDGATAGDQIAVYADFIFLPYVRRATIPAHRDQHGEFVPESTEHRWGWSLVRLTEDTRLRAWGSFNLPATDTRITMDARSGAAPLVAWATDRRISVAELNGDATGVSMLAEIAVGARPDRLVAARVADGVAVIARARNGLTLYRIRMVERRAQIETAPVPGRGYQLRLIAGPTGRPVITYSERGAALAMGLTPSDSTTG